MKPWKERILQMKFGKLVKRLTILSLCVVLLGGILSVVLLQPQISQFTSAVQQTEQMDGFREEPSHDWEGWDDATDITEPTLPVKAALLAIAAIFCLMFAVWWLLVPAWLYQASYRAQMNTLLWPLLGLIWSLWGLLLFLVIRSLLRRRCDSCGTWQRKGSYCRTCGTRFYTNCPNCGADCTSSDQFCSRCGSSLRSTENLETINEIR